MIPALPPSGAAGAKAAGPKAEEGAGGPACLFGALGPSELQSCLNQRRQEAKSWGLNSGCPEGCKALASLRTGELTVLGGSRLLSCPQ